MILSGSEGLDPSRRMVLSGSEALDASVLAWY